MRYNSQTLSDFTVTFPSAANRTTTRGKNLNTVCLLLLKSGNDVAGENNVCDFRADCLWTEIPAGMKPQDILSNLLEDLAQKTERRHQIKKKKKMRPLQFQSRGRGWGLYFSGCLWQRPPAPCAAAVCCGRIKLLSPKRSAPSAGRGGAEATTGRALACPVCLMPDLPLPARPNIIPLPGGDLDAPYTSEAIKKTVGIQ